MVRSFAETFPLCTWSGGRNAIFYVMHGRGLGQPKRQLINLSPLGNWCNMSQFHLQDAFEKYGQFEWMAAKVLFLIQHRNASFRLLPWKTQHYLAVLPVLVDLQICQIESEASLTSSGNCDEYGGGEFGAAGRLSVKYHKLAFFKFPLLIHG